VNEHLLACFLFLMIGAAVGFKAGVLSQREPGE
jgi:hypothetical protein